MGKKEDERSAAREFLLARLAICRGALAAATSSLDDVLVLFLHTDGDPKGKNRSKLLEATDAAIGDAAAAVQKAMEAMRDIDPEEEEPEADDEETDEDEDDEEDEEDD